MKTRQFRRSQFCSSRRYHATKNLSRLGFEFSALDRAGMATGHVLCELRTHSADVTHCHDHAADLAF